MSAERAQQVHFHYHGGDNNSNWIPCPQNPPLHMNIHTECAWFGYATSVYGYPPEPAVYSFKQVDVVVDMQFLQLYRFTAA